MQNQYTLTLAALILISILPDNLCANESAATARSADVTKISEAKSRQQKSNAVQKKAGEKPKQTKPNNPKQLTCEESDDSILINIGKKPVLRYNKSVQHPPESMSSVYQRSGYIHPIYTPSGREVTGDFAPDHAHQHAFFMAWTSAAFNGQPVDFWNQRKQQARISHSKVVGVTQGADNGKPFAQFTVELLHEVLPEDKEPITVLKEQWTVRVRDHRDRFVFDFTSVQECVADSPLTLNQYHYGGLGIRGNGQWLKDESKTAMSKWQKESEALAKQGKPTPPPPGLDIMGHDFLTSESKARHDGNHTRARWTDIYGPVDGELAGLAVLCHPENFRSPQHVRLHPAKPYFSYCPAVEGEFQIKPGEKYVSRFRVVAHDGKPDLASLDREWKSYSKLPNGSAGEK